MISYIMSSEAYNSPNGSLVLETNSRGKVSYHWLVTPEVTGINIFV